MSFIGVYLVKGWDNVWYFMTAKKLYKRVIRDSEFDFNWIASATELVRVCSKPNFPEKYAIGIKTAILNCFANLEKLGRWMYVIEPTDSDAVYFCYNSLLGNDEELLKAKRKYLAEFIRSASCVPRYKFSFHLDGQTYLKLREEWREKKLDEIAGKTELDFEQLFEELEDDFSQTVKYEEERGTFQEDDEKWRQESMALIDAVLKSRANLTLDMYLE